MFGRRIQVCFDLGIIIYAKMIKFCNQMVKISTVNIFLNLFIYQIVTDFFDPGDLT